MDSIKKKNAKRLLLFVLPFIPFVIFLNSSNSNVVNIHADYPQEVIAGTHFTMTVTIEKGNLSGFGRYTHSLPEGFTATCDAQNFEFENNTVKLLWVNLPYSQSFSFTYTIYVPESYEGDLTVAANFGYIMDNERRFSELIPQNISVINDPLALRKYKAQMKNRTQKIQPEDISAYRSVAIENNEAIISIRINKKHLQTMCKIEELLPEGYSFYALEKENAAFSTQNNVARYMWIDAPEKDIFTVAYKVIPNRGYSINDLYITGAFSYLDDNKTHSIVILEKDFNAISESSGTNNDFTPQLDSKYDTHQNIEFDEQRISYTPQKGTTNDNKNIDPTTIQSQTQKSSAPSIATHNNNKQPDIATQPTQQNIEIEQDNAIHADDLETVLEQKKYNSQQVSFFTNTNIESQPSDLTENSPVEFYDPTTSQKSNNTNTINSSETIPTETASKPENPSKITESGDNTKPNTIQQQYNTENSTANSTASNNDKSNSINKNTGENTVTENTVSENTVSENTETNATELQNESNQNTEPVSQNIEKSTVQNVPTRTSPVPINLNAIPEPSIYFAETDQNSNISTDTADTDMVSKETNPSYNKDMEDKQVLNTEPTTSAATRETETQTNEYSHTQSSLENDTNTNIPSENTDTKQNQEENISVKPSQNTEDRAYTPHETSREREQLAHTEPVTDENKNIDATVTEKNESVQTQKSEPTNNPVVTKETVIQPKDVNLTESELAFQSNLDIPAPIESNIENPSSEKISPYSRSKKATIPTPQTIPDAAPTNNNSPRMSQKEVTTDAASSQNETKNMTDTHINTDTDLSDEGITYNDNDYETSSSRLHNKNNTSQQETEISRIQKQNGLKGVYYRVQISASSKLVNVRSYFQKYQIQDNVVVERIAGWYKYSIEHLTTYLHARNYRNSIWNDTPIKDAFVVAYNDEQRITVQEALMLTDQQWYK
ncbi:MAG: hypothetical protein R6U95_10655 [Bacteroidales bacterium]